MFKSSGVIRTAGAIPVPEWYVYGGEDDVQKFNLAKVLAQRVGHKFRDRFTEWLGSAQLFLIGLILFHSQDSFNQSKAFVAMAAWMPEYSWAWLLTSAGVLGIIGLIINGSMEAVTPWIRVGRAIVGIITFSMLAVGLLIAHEVYSYNLAVMLGFALPMVAAEFGAIYYGIMDARIYQNGRRNRRSIGE